MQTYMSGQPLIHDVFLCFLTEDPITNGAAQ